MKYRAFYVDCEKRKLFIRIERLPDTLCGVLQVIPAQSIGCTGDRCGDLSLQLHQLCPGNGRYVGVLDAPRE